MEETRSRELAESELLMMPKPHKIWQVRIGSQQDGLMYSVQDLPLRATYLIESSFQNGIPTIERRALAMAAVDGISGAKILSIEWINRAKASPP